MKATLALAVVLLLNTAACAQAPTALRQVFREKIWEAVQGLDGVDALSSDVFYSLAYLDARKTILSAIRMASTSVERQAAGDLLDALNAQGTCRTIGQSGSAVDFRKCLDRVGAYREDALRAVGIDADKVYVHAPSKKENGVAP